MQQSLAVPCLADLEPRCLTASEGRQFQGPGVAGQMSKGPQASEKGCERGHEGCICGSGQKSGGQGRQQGHSNPGDGRGLGAWS